MVTFDQGLKTLKSGGEIGEMLFKGINLKPGALSPTDRMRSIVNTDNNIVV